MEGKKPFEIPRRFEDLLDYFEKGKGFTEELMRENERLRLRGLKLEKEKMELRSRGDPERLNQLLEENHKLRKRVEHLEARFDEIEKENKDFAQRYVEIHEQNDNLLNLYVSSYQLHSTLDPDQVIHVIQEIMLNLVGAEHFFVCMMDVKKELPVIVAGEGPEGAIRDKSPIEVDPVLAGVLREGKPYFRAPSESKSGHLACTPLKVKDDVVGAISIGKLMDQKEEGLTPIDHELLSMLADHAATALMSSHLYSRTERKLRTVEGFIELLKLDAAANPNSKESRV